MNKIYRINIIAAVGSASRGVAGSALISTLLMIVVLTIIVTAFMQSMAVERRTAASYRSKLQAELAAEAGIEALMNKLRSIDFSKGFVVIEKGLFPNDSGAPVVGVFSESGALTEIPLVTDASTIPEVSNPRNIDLNRRSGSTGFFSDEIRQGSGSELVTFRADVIPFAEVPNRTFSYAYRAVDESGKINLAHHCRSYDGSKRLGDDSVEEFLRKIAISGAIADGRTPGLMPDEITKFQDELENPTFGLNSLGQIFTSPAQFDSKKHLFTFHQGETVPTIPRGLRTDAGDWEFYVDGGKIKFDINELALDSGIGNSTERAVNIADIIDRNLPLFKQRDMAFTLGGLPDEQIRYVQRLAAGIVSYIDPNSPVVTLPDGDPAGRGLVPFPFKVCEKWSWAGVTGSPGAWTVSLRHTLFVELWNPNSKPVSGDFEFELITMIPIKFPEAIDTQFEPISGVANVSLGPNQIRVLNIASQVQQFSIPSVAQPSVATMDKSNSNDSDPNTNHSRFIAQWNGVPFDFTPNERQPFFELHGPGLVKESTSITSSGANSNRFSPNLQQVRFTGAASAKRWRPVGDPRHNFTNNYSWEYVSPTNANLRWNGRGLWDANSQLSQDYKSIWTDRDGMRQSPPVGSTRTALQDPDQVAQTYVEATHGPDAPFFIRGARMTSTAELGNIYDPAHLNSRGHATNAGNPDSYFSSGGGRTLRIGQAESPYSIGSPNSSKERLTQPWNTVGRRAMHLLDLFTVAEKDPDGIPRRRGAVNINTAHRDVLAAIFFNLTMEADAGAANSGTAAVTAQGSLDLADRIVSQRPYFSASDLVRVLDDSLASGTALPSLASAGIFSPSYGESSEQLDVMDRGREELFRRVYEAFSFNSGALKVISAGVVSDSSGRTISESRIEALIELRYERGSDGEPVIEPMIINTKFL